jgi:hypothetical protein
VNHRDAETQRRKEEKGNKRERGTVSDASSEAFAAPGCDATLLTKRR